MQPRHLLLLLFAACHHDAPAIVDTVAQDGDVDAVVALSGPSADATAPPADAPIAYVMHSPSPIFSDTEWPPRDPTRAADERKTVIRLGYLRKGSHVAIKPDPIKKPNCHEDWYELEAGGFVCGKFLTRDPNDPELQHPPSPPLTEGPLPYKYGMNLVNGAPMYRRLPKPEQKDEKEKGLMVGKTRPGDLARAQQEAVNDDNGDVPWYLQDHNGQKPTVSLDDLRDKGNDIVAMRMVKGFYISLDHEEKKNWNKFWETTSELYVPIEDILVHTSVTEFEGVNFESPTETRKLPLGWILLPKAWKFKYDADKKKMKRTEHVDRFSIVSLTGNRVEVDYKKYYETTDGWWMRDLDGTFTNPGPAPKDLAPGDKWIDINLTTQSLVAFDGDKPAYATILSSGKESDDKTKDHHTVRGDFSIREKHIAATMDDDSAGDGTYSIQDVPWVMYFHGGIALHGAFWHSAFGHQRSHGCINLTPFDAKNLFQWVGPRLPEGWHGVRATNANPGTRVIVHD